MQYQPTSIGHSTTPLARAVRSAALALLVGSFGAISTIALAENQLAEQQSQAFNIPSGPLSDALASFAATAGISVPFDTSMVEGRTSPGLTGSWSVSQGLEQLLRGTGVVAVSEGPGIYTLRSAPSTEGAVTIDPVTVIGNKADQLPPAYAGGQVATGGRVGIFGNRDIFDIPYSLVSFTRETIDNQQARTVAEVLRNDASVTITQNTNSGGTDDVYNIRGFLSASGSSTFDGLAALTGRSQAMEAIERVELLKGPSAFVNGAPGLVVGGSVNFVPKRATDTPLTQLTTRYYSDSVVGTHLDVGRRFGDENQWGVRFNGAYREGDTAIDHGNKQNKVSTLALDYRGESIRLFGDFEYSYSATENYMGGTGIAAGVDVPSAPENTNNWMQAWGFSYPQTKKRAVVRGEWDFAENWTASAAYGQLDQRDGTYTYCGSTIANERGDINYDCYVGGSQGDFQSGEAKLNGLVVTGPVTHRIALGATRYKQEFGGPFVNFTIPGSTGSNLYNPIYYPRPTTPEVTYDGKSSESILETKFIANEMGFLDDRLLISVGLRRMEFDFGNFNAITGARTSQTTKAATTPAYGIVYKLNSYASLYGNYAEAIEQGGTAPNNGTVDNPGEVIEPLRSEQLEAGIKLDFGSYGTTLGVFQITKANTAIVNRIYGNNGEQVNRGVELSVFGEPATGVRVLSGMSYIDAEQTKTQGGLTDGKTAIGVPKFQARLGGEWDIPSVMQGLTLTGHVAHNGSSYVDANNSRSIPSWTRLDAGARYTTQVSNLPTTLRLNVENLTNKNYWGSVDRGFLYVGQPRTLSLSATVNF
ncbi:TonB-dependent receptor [Pseudomonas sp. OTU750018]|uniref:TonB-dependent receptor n=1 Tax=Pseudomonas sp. OTU750018 TaxID=2709708 RepID=UPI00141EDF5E|nr:TonB-dependent receptor [Pseudomonas sp. OTU750018]